MATKKRMVRKAVVLAAGKKWGKTKKWGHGGARPGAGRPKSPDSGVPHKARPKVNKKSKVLLTYYFADLGLDERAKLRVAQSVVSLAAQASDGRYEFSIDKWWIANKAKERFLFHVVGVGAANTGQLSRAAQGLSVRVARKLNAALERKGKVFSDRYDVTVL